jgi:hypothetical protein
MGWEIGNMYIAIIGRAVQSEGLRARARPELI